MSVAKEMYALYIDAEKKILKGQSIKMGERLLTMADLSQVTKEREKWERKVNTENNKGRGHSTARFYL